MTKKEIKEAMTKLAHFRWANTSKKERKEHGAMLTRSRKKSMGKKV